MCGLFTVCCVGHDFQIWMSDSEGLPKVRPSRGSGIGDKIIVSSSARENVVIRACMGLFGPRPFTSENSLSRFKMLCFVGRILGSRDTLLSRVVVGRNPSNHPDLEIVPGTNKQQATPNSLPQLGKSWCFTVLMCIICTPLSIALKGRDLTRDQILRTDSPNLDE